MTREPSRLSRAGVCLAVAVLAIACESAAAQSPDAPRFNRDVRPILSDNCFHCHGPDKQRSRLRLDVPDVPVEKGAIVPGDTKDSELVKRIRSSDPEYRMPPPEANRTLTGEQIETLIEWIADGAAYERHWAFAPVPELREPVATRGAEWIANPIDAFVLNRLHEEGLGPSDEAPPERLLRRVTFDLAGRPPTIAELDAYLEDASPARYARVVERLLDSPEYGERMAVNWLDVARYADTFGYQDDKPNRVWPWRDWVIRAFNENLPYDAFVRWQVAGDLLPDPTQDQLLATAFNRLHRQTNEGGSINEEYLVEYAADRTHTFSTAFMGITMKCARCHDHKFDPISQREYYELFAFFSNIDESGMYSHFTDATPTPSMFLYADGQRAEHQALKDAIQAAEQHLKEVRGEAEDRFAKWLDAFDGAIDLPEPLVHLPLDEISGESTLASGTGEVATKIAGTLEAVSGARGGAVRFSGDNAVEVRAKVDFERTDPFTIAFWMNAGGGEGRMVIAHHTKASSDAGSRGYELFLQDGHLVAGLNHFWPGNALRVETARRVPRNRWVHVAMTYDGSSRAQGIHLYLDGAPVEVTVVRDNLYSTVRYEGQPDLPVILGARFRDPGFKDGAIDEFRVFRARLSGLEVRALFEPDETGYDEHALFAYYLARVDDEYREKLDRLRQARKAESAFADSLRQIMIMRERPDPASAHLLARGAYDRPIEEVFPGTPEAILPFPDDYPRNRLGLAEWLLRRDHPLTSRVAVNRIWQTFFGRGLVETPEDFGNQGSPPSHPELLDYLAAWFMESGWDMKALCRLIVTSSTYRQDSRPTPESAGHDPENILLARGPRFRLSAEQIRDAALFASGLLVEQQGGPSVKPYQPEGLWREASNVAYTPGTGTDLYRRSMYTFIKRTVPPPMMLTFDATNREVCIARRSQTTTPLQALVLLNDPQFVEASRALAENVVERHAADVSARLEEAFRRLTGRVPREQERAILMRAYRAQYGAYSADPKRSDAYTSVGERAVDEDLDPAELAATTAVIQLIMNFEEFQVKL